MTSRSSDESNRFSATRSGNIDTSDLSMVPSRDDLDQHAGHELAETEIVEEITPSIATLSATASKSVPLIWVVVLFIAIGLIAAIGALGALQMQQQIASLSAQLGNSSSALDQSKQNIAELNAKLSATGENVNKTGSEALKQVESLKEQLKQLNDTGNASAKSALENASHTLSAHEESLKKVGEQTAKLAEDFQNLQASLAKITDTQVTQSNSYAELKQQVVELDGQITSLRLELQKSAQSEALTQKIASLEEEVRSFDAFRRQTNASLSQLNIDVQMINEKDGKK